MKRTRGKRVKSPTSSANSGNSETKKKKHGKYSVPSNPTLDAAGNLLPPISHNHAIRSRSVSMASRASYASQQSKRSLTSKVNSTSTSAKPIFADSNIRVVKNVLANIQSSLKSQPTYKIISEKQVKIVCSNAEDKTKVIEKLDSQKIPSFTFSETKPTIYVLKGYEHAACDDVKSLLNERELPVTKVTFLVDNPHRPIYLIHFEQQKANLRMLQACYKYVDNTVIKWERFDRTKKRLTQCHNCQTYGHTASNCKRQYRCVKCIKDHKPGECERKTAKDEGKPACVNCQGDHTANSRKCEFFISYAGKVKRNRINRQQVDQQTVSQPSTARWASPNSSIPPTLNEINFPRINPHTRVNVSSTLNESSPDPFAQLDSLKTRLNAIPGIQQTLKTFGDFVSHLESAQDERERQSILFKFLIA